MAARRRAAGRPWLGWHGGHAGVADTKGRCESMAEARTGLRRGLKNRHIQLIALGGAIGTGLFYGSLLSIQLAGPAVLVAYALGGAVIFLIMRALGEMSVEAPVSGAFSQYAYAYWGDFPGFLSGWNYWLNYVAVAMAELSVVGTYVNFWWPGVPTWASALVFWLLVTAVNLASVRLFGEFEFWFAIVKVAAIVAIIAFGLGMVLFGVGAGGHPVGLANLWSHGGFFAGGAGGFAASLVVVMFSFGGVELIGITAGEADDPRRSIPRAVNQVVGRILLFYVGSIAVMLAIVPWNRLGQGASPFVLIFERLGIPGAATLLNVVVLTAAVSAYNSALYSNGRMLYGLAVQGNAPRAFLRVSSRGAPWVGTLLSSAVTGLAVLVLYLLPDGAFTLLLSVALFAGIVNWAMIVLTQWRFRNLRRRRGGPAPAFPMPGHPWANALVLAFLVAMLVVMAFLPDYRTAVIVGPAWLALLGALYRAKAAFTRRARSRGAADRTGVGGESAHT